MKETKSYKRIKLWLRIRLRLAQVQNGWPFLIWLAAVIVLIYLLLFRTGIGTVTGIVDTMAEPVAALETARVTSIDVTIGQRVNAGDILVRLDTFVVDSELRQIEAEMAEALNSIGNFERQTLGTVKTFEDAIKDAQATIEDLKRQQARDTALLAQLEEQQTRYDELFAQKLIDATTAYGMKPNIAGLRSELEAYPFMMDVEQRRLSDAIAARQELYKSLRLREGEDIRVALSRRAEDQQAIFDANLKAALTRQATYTLRATFDGTVSRILHHPGHIVPAGEPILRVITEHSNFVIGFLPEVHMGTLQPGQEAQVWRQHGSNERFPVRVVTVAPEIDTMPARLSVLGTQLLRGRRIIFELMGDHNLVPGETVQIRPVGGAWQEPRWRRALTEGIEDVMGARQ